MKKALLVTGVFMASVLMLSACGKKAETAPATASETTAAGTTAAKSDTAGSDAAGSEASAEEEPSFSNFKAVTLDGEEASQDIFADYDLTMVNVWATFCGPCLREMPDLGEIHKEYADKKFQIVGIVSDVFNSDGSLSESQIETAREIVSETGAEYTHLIPTYDLQMAKLKDVSVVPTTFFVDKDGNPVGEDQLGSKSKKDWKKLIDKYLGEVE